MCARCSVTEAALGRGCGCPCKSYALFVVDPRALSVRCWKCRHALAPSAIEPARG